MKPLCVLLLVLASCAGPTVELSTPDEVKPQVTPCRPGVAQAPAPPLPRTVDSIVDAYNKAKSAGLATEAALRECAAKVDLLISH